MCCKCLGISTRPSGDETKERLVADAQHKRSLVVLGKKRRLLTRSCGRVEPKDDVRLNSGTGSNFTCRVLKHD